MAIRPVFLLSSPRSGSTLVQRVLACHEDIATMSEPWLLRHLIQPLGRSATRFDGWNVISPQAFMARASERLMRELPGGRPRFAAEVRQMALRLYAETAGRDSGYFLDKSPPYLYYVDEVAETFPDAKLIFLWRNPLAVVGSTVELFCGGRWEPNRLPYLLDGPERLVPAYRRYRDRAVAVRFEDLIDGGEQHWRTLFGHLGLDFDHRFLSRFVELELEGGDPVGRRYRGLSKEPLDKWRRVITNPARKAWCRRYLHWIGADRLDVMGYNPNELLAELDSVEVGLSGTAEDLIRIARSMVSDALRARIAPFTGRTWGRLLDG